MAAAALAWVTHDTRPIFCCLAAILASVLLLGVTRLPPLLSILDGTSIAGRLAEAVAKAFSRGAGGILGEAGIIIAPGSRLGAMMAEAGAADRIGSTLLGLGKGRSRPWGMARVAKVRESFGLKLKQTLEVWSVLQTLVSITGLAGKLLLSLWI